MESSRLFGRLVDGGGSRGENGAVLGGKGAFDTQGSKGEPWRGGGSLGNINDLKTVLILLWDNRISSCFKGSHSCRYGSGSRSSPESLMMKAPRRHSRITEEYCKIINKERNTPLRYKNNI